MFRLDQISRKPERSLPEHELTAFGLSQALVQGVEMLQVVRDRRNLSRLARLATQPNMGLIGAALHDDALQRATAAELANLKSVWREQLNLDDLKGRELAVQQLADLKPLGNPSMAHYVTQNGQEGRIDKDTRITGRFVDVSLDQRGRYVFEDAQLQTEANGQFEAVDRLIVTEVCQPQPYAPAGSKLLSTINLRPVELH